MQTTVPALETESLDTPIPFKLSPLALAALQVGVAFDDIDAYVDAAPSYQNAVLPELVGAGQFDLDTELDIALAASASAREPARSVVWWKAAGL